MRTRNNSVFGPFYAVVFTKIWLCYGNIIKFPAKTNGKYKDKDKDKYAEHKLMI